MKKENTEQQKQIYSIRKNKAYGASSVLIGLMGSAFLLSGLAPTVQAEENDAKPETKPADGSAVNGTNAPTVETEHLIIASQPKESNPKSESTSTDNPKTDVENASTNETKPLNSESTQPKEEPAASVNPTEGANSAAPGTPEAKPTEEKSGEQPTPSKRSVSIVYKVRYVDRKSGKVVHEVTKTKTVETTEAKAKASVTEIGAELANDSQLENYYVPDGNPTTMTKEIVEGADNVFVYEVEGFGEAETPKERTVALKYTVEYVDKKSGLILASEEKEEKVSTTETVAKKEVTIQPSLTANEKLKDWVLSDGAPASQKLTLTEGKVGKVTFNLQNSEGGKVRNKRKVDTPIITGQPYLTLENKTDGFVNRENMTLNGNGQSSYNVVYKIGASNLPNNNLEELVMTQGAKDLGFTLNRTEGTLKATINPAKFEDRDYEVGFYVNSRPDIKVAGTIKIIKKEHYGFMIFGDYRVEDSSNSGYYYFYKNTDKNPREGNPNSHYSDYDLNSPIYGGEFNSEGKSRYVSNNHPATEVTIDGLRMPTTPFGYFMPRGGLDISSTDRNTSRYYSMLPIFAPMDRSTDFVGNDKEGLSIKRFEVIESTPGVDVKLVDLRVDKAPDKGVYSNSLEFQTVTAYNENSGYPLRRDPVNEITNTPYYLQFTKLPKTAGNYYVTVGITDNLGLTKKIRLNFTTYENSTSGGRSSNASVPGESYALTVADTLFEPNEKYVNKETKNLEIPVSNEKQILGKVILNKENAYIKADQFPSGVRLETKDGTPVDETVKVTEAYVVKRENGEVKSGAYTFSVKAYDGHFQEGGSRSFGFEIVEGINPIANQRWKEGSVPTPIPVSMQNGSRIREIRVESNGDYAVFEGNSANSNISIYGLKRTTSPQKARVYVKYKDGNNVLREVFTDFDYEIIPNEEADFTVSVTNPKQEIREGDSWKDMEITTTGEDVTIKVDKTKLPKGTRLVGNVIKGKGFYEGVYDIPILAIKRDSVNGDRVKSTVVKLTVKPGIFKVEPETSEVEVFSNDIKAITTDENGETKTPVTRYGLQNIPKDAKVTYSGGGYDFIVSSGLKISEDGTEITGTPKWVGKYTIDAKVSQRDSNGVTRTAVTTYNINVTGLTPSLTISSAAQPEHPTDAYTDHSYRLIAPLGSPIPTITIKHGPHSWLNFGGGLP